MLSGTVDLSKLYQSVQALPDEYRRARALAFKEVGDGLLKNIKARAPVDTGKYKTSWYLKAATDKRCVVETPMRQLFLILEYQGSKPHIIRPKRKQFLRWPVRESKRKTVRTAGPSPALPQGGRQVYAFAREVKHPGFKPIRHARPAHRSVMRQALPIFYKHMGRIRVLSASDAKKYANAKVVYPSEIGQNLADRNRPLKPRRATGDALKAARAFAMRPGSGPPA